MDFWIKPRPFEVVSAWMMGFIGIAAPLALLIGVLGSIPWLMMLGGITLVVRDVAGVMLGVLNPVFPLVFAVVLALFVDPWYVGVFWASAVFAVLGLPFHLNQVLFPRAAVARALRDGDPGTLLDRIARGG
jgi:hypothetical protein